MHILAKIIARDVNRSNTLVINKGSHNGLSDNLPVTTEQGIILGKIMETKNSTATVLLLTDPGSQIAVTTPEYNTTIGLAQGEFGLSIKIELIPQNITINPGDTIITSGIEENMPNGLVIGKVNRVFSNENELFKTATINPLINYEEVNIVSVIKK